MFTEYKREALVTQSYSYRQSSRAPNDIACCGVRAFRRKSPALGTYHPGTLPQGSFLLGPGRSPLSRYVLIIGHGTEYSCNTYAVSSASENVHHIPISDYGTSRTPWSSNQIEPSHYARPNLIILCFGMAVTPELWRLSQ